MLHWVDKDVVLQLLIVHSDYREPDDFIAQIKLAGSDGPSRRRSEKGFTTLSEFEFKPFEFDWAEPAPDDDRFPNIFHDEFVGMVRYWKRVLELMECGPALG